MRVKSIANISLLEQLHWYHWLVLIASLALTLSAWRITSVQAEQRMSSQFAFQANQIVQLVKERMEMYEEALYGGVASLKVQNNTTDSERWRVYSSALAIDEKYPGINGIGVIYRVTPENLQSYLARERQLRPDYAIHPPHNESEYWPITYIEPVDINRKAVGLDMAHETNRYTAAKHARDTGTTQMTGPIVLVQDNKKTPGFLLFVPFYSTLKIPATVEERQQAFVGIVYAPFIMQKLMKGTLLNANRLVNFSIEDQGSMLYSEMDASLPGGFDLDPLYRKSFDVEIYGRLWKFNVQTSQLFRQQYKSHQPVIILAGGILIDVLLLILFVILASSNKKAVELASIMSRKSRLSEEKLNLTIKSMMDGLLTIDESGQLVSMNPMAEKLFGMDAKQLGRCNIHSLIMAPDDEALDFDVDKLLLQGAGENRVYEAHARNQVSGEIFPIELTAGEVHGADNVCFTLIIRDITERKRAERLKSEYVSTVSHELRTPLTSITGSIRLVQIQGEGQLTEVIQTMLAIAYRNCERLNRIINDLLDMEKLDKNAVILDIVETDLLSLIQRVVEDNISFADQHQVMLQVHTSLPSAFVKGDEFRLSQVLGNLLSNAIKYSPEGETVDISIVEAQGVYRVSICDHGPGVSEEFAAKIFKRFAQADGSDTREKGGTGLGLSISKAIIELHKGKIGYQSVTGEGSCFYFELPVE